MPFKIVRNDITKMTTQAIVNTANEQPVIGAGCDTAVYQAAGWEKLLAYRKEHIGTVPEGDAFLTPGFALPAEYIIHAVSPLYKQGSPEEEEKLRSCYSRSLAIASEHGITSIAFPLIATGSYGYPKEEGMRIAIDEIHSFLLTHDMMIYLVVFSEDAARMGRNIDPRLAAYIDRKYVREKWDQEYASPFFGDSEKMSAPASGTDVRGSGGKNVPFAKLPSGSIRTRTLLRCHPPEKRTSTKNWSARSESGWGICRIRSRSIFCI